MRDIRGAFLAGAAAVVFGCQSAPEPLIIPPLPADQPADLPELLNRARLQASTATEASYLDDWSALDDAAVGLAKTAGRLPQAEKVPPDRLARLEKEAAALGKDAGRLREAARNRDVEAATAALARINRAVRDLSANRDAAPDGR
jgi:hypothetical protein